MIPLLQINVSAININYCDLCMMLVFKTDTFALELLLKENVKKILSAVNTATLYFKKNHIYCMQFLKGWGLFLNQSSSVGALCWEASLILRLYLETKGKWKKLYNTLFSYCTLFCFSLAKLLNIQ